VRTAFRAAAVTVGTSVLTLTASPAFAAHPDDGSQPGKGFSVLQTLFWFVAVPALIIGTIWLLVWIPGMTRGPRYRPGVSWWAAPAWFNGPTSTDVASAVAEATPTQDGGGASARW
jgi:hypothetical protein